MLPHASFGLIAYAVVLVTLVAVVIALVLALLRALSSGDVPRIESWEGFGGGVGGWQVSRSLVLLLAALLFASLAAVTVRGAASDVRSATTPADSTRRGGDVLPGLAPIAADTGKAAPDTAHTKTTSRQ